MRVREEFEREIIPGISQRTPTLGNWMTTHLAPGNTMYRQYANTYCNMFGFNILFFEGCCVYRLGHRVPGGVGASE